MTHTMSATSTTSSSPHARSGRRTSGLVLVGYTEVIQKRVRGEGFSTTKRSSYETATTRTVASSSNSPPQNSVTRSSNEWCSVFADS